jgi:hypothetical protein
LQAEVAEVVTEGGSHVLDEYIDPADIDELPDLPDPVEPAEPRWKKARDQWNWEDEARSFMSKPKKIFPAANYTRFTKLAPVVLFELFFGDDILDQIATKSNEYAMMKFGNLPSITADDIKTFFAILILSGYNKVVDFKQYWSNSEDTENRMIKAAMSRDKFLMVKRCFHLGNDSELEGDRSVLGCFLKCLFGIPYRFVYIYIYLYIYIHTHTHTPPHTPTHIYIHYIHTYIHT